MISATMEGKTDNAFQAEPLQDRCLREASAIADELLRSRAGSSHGGSFWRGPSGYGTDLSPLQISKLGPHLYDGTTGTALFLAALGFITGKMEYSDTALWALEPLRHKLRKLAADPTRASSIDIPIGGLIGIGAFIYTFVRVAEWLDEPQLLRDAQEASCLITTARIARDHRVRVQTGSAGAILALLALHRASPEKNRQGRSPLDLARECARHLLDTQISYEGRPKAWPLSPNKPPLLGFCYGAAGISFSLLKLFEVCPSQEIWEGALEGWAYVDSFYHPGERAWTDVRAVLQSRFEGPRNGSWRDWWLSGSSTTADLQPRTGSIPESGLRLANKWCHGAPGIALARLAGLSRLDTLEIREEIRGALTETREIASAEIFAQHSADDLCCGHMGRAEALLQASHQLADPSLLEAAREIARQTVDRARDNGGYTVTAARGSRHFSPSLFQGHAGIGYTLLRLARPGELSCLLLLE